MPWNYNDAEINGIIDGSLKDAPPAAPMSNTAGSVRSLLKNMWLAIRGQVKTAVDNIDAVNASLVARSLNLSATIYVNQTTGDDARTGETNNANALTGAVKTLERAIALHSDKTHSLRIEITGVYQFATDLTITVPNLVLSFGGMGTGIVFKKKVTGAGEGNYKLICNSDFVYVVNISGSITVEGSLGTDKASLGAISIAKPSIIQGLPRFGIINLYVWRATFVLGENAVFANSGIAGTNSVGSTRDLYQRITVAPSTVTIDATATESTLIGNRIFNRQYHPLSSTDANVSEGETVLSPTNNKLWTKRAGTIRDAMGTTFV